MFHGVWEALREFLLHEHLIGNLESLAKILAIVAGGGWAYWTFVLKRTPYPKAEIHHSIGETLLPNGSVVLHVALVIENKGGTLIRIKQVDTRIQHVLPLTEKEIREMEEEHDPLNAEGARHLPWPMVARRLAECTSDPMEIEPGESESVFYDFRLQPDTEVVRVYSHVAAEERSKTSKPMGWQQVTFHHFNQELGQDSSEKETEKMIERTPFFPGGLPERRKITKVPPETVPPIRTPPDRRQVVPEDLPPEREEQGSDPEEVEET